jgi:hypothetical protein
MFQQLRVLFPDFAERFESYLAAAQDGSAVPAKRSR